MAVGDTVSAGAHSIEENIDLAVASMLGSYSGNSSMADEIIAAEFEEHIPQTMPGARSTKGAEAVRSFASMFLEAIPDLHLSI